MNARRNFHTRVCTAFVGMAVGVACKGKAFESRAVDEFARPAESARAPIEAAREAGAPLDMGWDPYPTAWTDPRVVDAVAHDCNFIPTKEVGSPDTEHGYPHGETSSRTDPLQCQLRVYHEQSCVADPCDGESRGTECRLRCETGCDACGGQCGSTCERCKQTCATEPCRHRCAESCASCKQACLGSRDRCASGTCTIEAREHYRACRGELRAKWIKNRCSATCVQYRQCYRACTKDAPHGDTSSDKFRACLDAKCEPMRSGRACVEACTKAAAGSKDASCEAQCFDQPCELRLCEGALGVAGSFSEELMDVFGGGSVNPEKLPQDVAP